MSDFIRKISTSEFQLDLDGQWLTLFVPYGKVQDLVKEFGKQGGMYNMETGEVAQDVFTLMNQFETLGTILISTYDDKGKCTEVKTCAGYSYEAVIRIFTLAEQIITSFFLAISASKKEIQADMAEAPEKEKKVKKTSH